MRLVAYVVQQDDFSNVVLPIEEVLDCKAIKGRVIVQIDSDMQQVVLVEAVTFVTLDVHFLHVDDYLLAIPPVAKLILLHDYVLVLELVQLVLTRIINYVRIDNLLSNALVLSVKDVAVAHTTADVNVPVKV